MNGEGFKEHRTRELLYDYIREKPGSSFKILKSAFKLTDGTLRYHLSILLKRNKIVQEKMGREKCYFTYSQKCFPFSKSDITLNVHQEYLIDLISANPGISFKELKLRSGMSKAKFNYNLKKLKNSHMIWRIKREGKLGFEIVSKEKLTEEMFLILVKKYLNGNVEKEILMKTVKKLKDFNEEDK